MRRRRGGEECIGGGEGRSGDGRRGGVDRRREGRSGDGRRGGEEWEEERRGGRRERGSVRGKGNRRSKDEDRLVHIHTWEWVRHTGENVCKPRPQALPALLCEIEIALAWVRLYVCMCDVKTLWPLPSEMACSLSVVTLGHMMGIMHNTPTIGNDRLGDHLLHVNSGQSP